MGKCRNCGQDGEGVLFRKDGKTIEMCEACAEKNKNSLLNGHGYKLYARRIWVLTDSPVSLEYKCPLCGGVNIQWSEYEDHLWCYDCKKDILYEKIGHIFPIRIARILGFNLSMRNIKTGEIKNLEDEQ